MTENELKRRVLNIKTKLKNKEMKKKLKAKIKENNFLTNNLNFYKELIEKNIEKTKEYKLFEDELYLQEYYNETEISFSDAQLNDMQAKETQVEYKESRGSISKNTPAISSNSTKQISENELKLSIKKVVLQNKVLLNLLKTHKKEKNKFIKQIELLLTAKKEKNDTFEKCCINNDFVEEGFFNMKDFLIKFYNKNKIIENLQNENEFLILENKKLKNLNLKMKDFLVFKESKKRKYFEISFEEGFFMNFDSVLKINENKFLKMNDVILKMNDVILKMNEICNFVENIKNKTFEIKKKMNGKIYETCKKITDKINEENDKMRSENYEMCNEISNLRIEIERMSDEIGEHKNRIEMKEDEILGLKRENESLNDEIEILNEDKKRNCNTDNSIKEENEELKLKLEEFREIFESLQNDISKCEECKKRNE